MGFAKVVLKIGNISVVEDWVDTEDYRQLTYESDRWSSDLRSNTVEQVCGCGRAGDHGAFHDCYCEKNSEIEKVGFICETSDFMEEQEDSCHVN